MKILKYPIGVQTFSTILEEGYVYADKTGYLRHLLEQGAKNVLYDYEWEAYPKGYNSELNCIKLGFPNRDVVLGFFNQLVKIYASATQDDSVFSVVEFYDDVAEGNAEALLCGKGKDYK